MRVDSVHREKGMDRHDESSTQSILYIQHNEVLCYITMSDVYHDESRLSPSRERHGSPCHTLLGHHSLGWSSIVVPLSDT